MGDSHHEAASLLGTTALGIRKRLMRARQRIRAVFDRLNIVDRERYAPLLNPRPRRIKTFQLNAMDQV